MLNQLAELDNRRESILASLKERELLTDELEEKVDNAETLTELEDIYLPYRPKRRTRASIAKEKGLEPLAQRIFIQEDMDLIYEATPYIDPSKDLNSIEDVLTGARDIIAEWISEDIDARTKTRELLLTKGIFRAKVIPGKEIEGIKYKDYFNWEESVPGAPSHRVLAMRRGENEGFLTLQILAPDEEILYDLENLYLRKRNDIADQVRLSIHDGYKRLLLPSIITEVRLATKEQADEDAIKVFAENLHQLLLAPPLGQKNVLAIDPGFRTGCKVCCLDRQGKFLHYETIFPHTSEQKSLESGTRIKDLYSRFDIEAVAIGNGTAGKETENFIQKLNLPNSIPVVMVNESGASIYSASEVAREEFSDLDITIRGAISIGRRLMDPLAELVKIDPKSIGVGQYQHDVDQTKLKRGLDDVVISCVNNIGVEVNTASVQLLTYVSGLGPKLAKSIVDYRNENGPFKSREELINVPRLGPKAFEQAAGFLRIRDCVNPLDKSAVHPESYHIVYSFTKDLGCSIIDLMREEALRKRIDIKKYITETIGIPTLTDILSELAKPGRDPRKQFEIFKFAEGIEKIEDLQVGMKLPGIITNITAFGAFVDIGIHNDGLVHVSQLSKHFIRNPGEVVKVHQKVMVVVREVDLERKRISLSMKDSME
jgi:uncharacterized protein